ncbi:hypothetical protein MTQ01_20040 [Streptomyces sp. XM4193]|uniref:hypothetical protein n=1 Tax=Streptomyces sp. XM4193 TaxID=2929782 RepID=UPI001FF7A7F4|nr:hypothetical protein [Streptomyces sp. XM4193]MCK1798274.1 hypothetical protein [Streptomyces sp. XM4193]
MRNPVGPLPSSIYWRRRAVALALVAMLVMLVVWALSMGGGGGNQAGKAGQDDRGEGAASSITPGPTSSESVPDNRPGGRDEEDEEGSGGADDDNEGGTGGSGSGGSEESEGSDSDAGSGGSGGSGGGGDVDGLDACRSGQAKVSLVAARNEYAPGERPKLRLTVENTSGTPCKVDVNGDRAVFTIVDSDDSTIWSSEHCAADGSDELRVAAREKTTHTLTWKRDRSAASCATPSGGAPKAGTYLVEVEIPGLGTAQTSFVLAKD